MESNSNIQNNITNEANNSSIGNPHEADTSKLITAITDFIPTFFSPNGVLQKENNEKNKPNILEIVVQSEDFFKDHPNSFKIDESKNSFIVNKLTGTARKWGLSLLTDGTLKTLSFEEFRKLLLENFDSRQ